MTQYGMTEPDAFRWIQRRAMDHRLSMRVVAEEVLQGAQQAIRRQAARAGPGDAGRASTEPGGSRRQAALPGAAAGRTSRGGRCQTKAGQ